MNKLNHDEQYRKTNVMPYDPKWPLYYVNESKKIATLLKDNLIAVHHIGSTAVPGMLAKPVIDILVVLKDITQLENYRLELESLGYHWKGEYGIAGRRYLWKVENNQIDFHLQCFQSDHIGSKNTLIFRDFLRLHPDKALEYVKAKKEASEKYPTDTHAYWHEKSSMVDSLLNDALHWHNQLTIEKKQSILNSEMLQTLEKIKKQINNEYGYHEGIPRINYGPCGVFAKIFFDKWNALFDDKVHICFIMLLTKDECDHIVIKLPSGEFYDGGIGIHTAAEYANKFLCDEMVDYDEVRLEKWSYGLNRTYPRFCLNFNRTVVEEIISKNLEELFRLRSQED